LGYWAGKLAWWGPQVASELAAGASRPAFGA
jgi:hypothetical protein